MCQFLPWLLQKGACPANPIALHMAWESMAALATSKEAATGAS